MTADHTITYLHVPTGSKVSHAYSTPVFHAQFSPDAQWYIAQANTSKARGTIFIRPLFDKGDPVPITGGNALDTGPTWSDESDAVLFLSDRDGHRCVWGRKLDPHTHQPSGDIFDIYHFHRPGARIRSYGFGRIAAKVKLILAVSERTGDLYTTRMLGWF